MHRPQTTLAAKLPMLSHNQVPGNSTMSTCLKPESMAMPLCFCISQQPWDMQLLAVYKLQLKYNGLDPNLVGGKVFFFPISQKDMCVVLIPPSRCKPLVCSHLTVLRVQRHQEGTILATMTDCNRRRGTGKVSLYKHCSLCARQDPLQYSESISLPHPQP